MTDPYRWIYDFAEQAMADNRPDKLQLIDILAQSESLSNENPDARLALCEQGRALAQSLDEPWWSATFDYWKSEILLYYKHDPQAALDVAAKLVVETRKPIYDAFPHRSGAHLNFIAAYSKIDPIGYAPQIRAALNDEAAWNPEDSSHGVYWQLKTRFLTAIGEPEAVEVAWGHFDFSCDFHARRDPSSSHYIIYALVDLLSALNDFDDAAARRQTAELAELGAQLSRRDENERLGAIFTMWQAVGARFAGDEGAAQRWYRLAMQLQNALSPPRNAVFTAALRFHEVGSELEIAAIICDEAAKIAREHGHFFDCATFGFKKCAISRELGRDFAVEAASVREVAAKLPSKPVWEARLSELEESDGQFRGSL